MSLFEFIKESNKIEGIFKDPGTKEFKVYQSFLGLETVNIADLENFVQVVQPRAKLRDREGLNVRVGEHIAPAGGPDIKGALQEILNEKGISPWTRHKKYLDLHPFTDGNGRSARVLWLREMEGTSIGFLHQFYYQTLRECRL